MRHSSDSTVNGKLRRRREMMTQLSCWFVVLSVMYRACTVTADVLIESTQKVDSPIGNEIYEIRIYETAPPGTKATLNEAFDRVMREQKNCFAQLETAWDTDWIEFDSALLMFITTADVPTTARTTQQAVLHLMCASNKMRSIHFSIHVTRRNRHPPKFVADVLEFYAPATFQPGAEIGRLQVIDNDPIIYNSQVQLNILPSLTKIGGSSRIPSLDVNSPAISANDVEGHWLVLKNGSIVVNKAMTDLQLYRPYIIRVLAVDFGSPQLFSICNVTIVPVSVSQPRNVRANVANTEYQVFEWEAPAFGIPEKYRIAIRRLNVLLHSMEVEASENIVLSRVRFPSGPDYTVTITAVDVDGSSPSDPYPFMLIHTELACEGECAPGGGIPLCYYGRFHKIEQYRDANGPHCICYDGFSSPQCDVIESCPGERILEPYGGVDWPFTPVNQSSSIPCPYSANDEMVTRKCFWDARLKMARWQNVSNNDICKKQSSVLVHLGMMANYAQRAEQTASGLRAVQRFLADVLRMPAFRPQVRSAHFDAKIAEHVVQLLDTLAAVNLTAISANTSDISAGVVDYVMEFARRIPVPFHLQSADGGFQIRTWHWLGSTPPTVVDPSEMGDSAMEIGDEFPAQFGRRCYIHLPTRRRQRGGSLIVHNSDAHGAQIVRVACLRATTMLPLLEGRSPVMFVSVDTDDDSSNHGEKQSTNENDDEAIMRRRTAGNAGSPEIQHGRIAVVTGGNSNHYSHAIPRQKIANGAKALVALRPEPLASAHGALLGYGDAGVNYTCAIYDHSKFGWSITGVTVLSRNFEDGFVLCESTHLGVFALLPESLFEAKQVALLRILITILPIATASFAVLCTLFLLLIAILQRPRCPDPALILFLLTFLGLHFLHLFLLVGPHLAEVAALLVFGDRAAYLGLQYTLLSIAALLMLLAAATHARIIDLEAGVRRVVSRCCRLISTLVLGVVLPLLMCLVAWFFNGNIYENIIFSNPRNSFRYLRAFNWAFAVSFALPLVLFVGSATAYASYSYYYARSSVITIIPPTSNGHHVALLSSTASPYSAAVVDSGRQRLLRDLSSASLFLLAIILLTLVNAVVFLQTDGTKRSLLVAFLHLSVSAAVFIFTGLLYRIELKFPRYTRGNHIGEARRLFANGANGSAFLLGNEPSKSNGNANSNGTAPLIFNAADETDAMAANIRGTKKSSLVDHVDGSKQRNGILAIGANGASAYEGRKSNYFAYDASHGRASFITQLGAASSTSGGRAGREDEDNDSGRMTLASPAPSSTLHANTTTAALTTADASAESDGSPISDVGTASSSCNNNNHSGGGSMGPERGYFSTTMTHRRGSQSNGANIERRIHSDRYGSLQYDNILSPTPPQRSTEMNRSLYGGEICGSSCGSTGKWSTNGNESDRLIQATVSYHTAALQEQQKLHLTPLARSEHSSPASVHAGKMSLLKLNFLYGKEMETLQPMQLTTVHTTQDVDLTRRHSVLESEDLSSSAVSTSTPSPAINSNSIVENQHATVTRSRFGKGEVLDVQFEINDPNTHPVVSVV